MRDDVLNSLLPSTYRWALVRDLTDQDVHLERALGEKCPALASTQVHDTNLYQVIKISPLGEMPPPCPSLPVAGGRAVPTFPQLQYSEEWGPTPHLGSSTVELALRAKVGVR